MPALSLCSTTFVCINLCQWSLRHVARPRMSVSAKRQTWIGCAGGARRAIWSALPNGPSETAAMTARPCIAAASTANTSESHAWVSRTTLSGAESGPLRDQNLRFAVKDMYSIAGHTNACGNPTWLATHDAATQHAPCVAALLDAGADCIGVTQMDELAYSLNGENAHFGTPANPAAPGRIPGGSSSGSAVRAHCRCSVLPSPGSRA